MGKPNYRVLVSYDPQRAVFCARTPELENLNGEALTRKDAITRLEEEIDAQLANMLSLGTTPPRAIDEDEFSGEVQAKISRGLHRDLTYIARSEGVELDQIVSELLASAITLRQGGRGGRPQRQAGGDMPDDIGNRVDRSDGNRGDGNRGDGNRRGGFSRGPNPQIMDNQANFIEYVRGLESGGPSGGHARHGGGGHGGGGHGGGGHNNAGNNARGGRRRRGGGGGPGGPPQGRDGNRPPGGPQHGHQQGRGPGGQGSHLNAGSNGGAQPSGAQQAGAPAAQPAPGASTPEPRDS